MPNPFVHVELNTTDVDKAKAFYGGLFDWKLEDIPGGGYTMIQVGTGTGGGMMKHPVPGAPSAWLAYVEVADIHAATQKAASLGENYEGCHGSDGDGLALDPDRPDGGSSGTLAAEKVGIQTKVAGRIANQIRPALRQRLYHPAMRSGTNGGSEDTTRRCRIRSFHLATT